MMPIASERPAKPPVTVRAAAQGWLQQLRIRPHTVINIVFAMLIASFVLSLTRYWTNTLEPRLYSTAETQASILAQSQATGLVEAIEHGDPERMRQRLFDLLQEALIVKDPATGGRIVLGLSLQIDYDAVRAAPGTLDLKDGMRVCERCFHAAIPLIGQGGLLLGVADFVLSPSYFDTLAKDMRSKLMAESSLAMILMFVVWITMLAMFHRLHRAKLAIEASDRAKTRFMANVTHELRTPLNAILGYTQLYRQDTALMARHGQGIDTIDRSAEHLLLMINDILDFSRMGETRLALHPREVPLAGFLSTLVEMTEVRARLKGIQVERRFQPELPAALVVDDKRLRQVLLNLLGNAVKFTEQGKVLFEVGRLETRDSERVRLRFSVRDSGIGIGRAELENIFIPFQQLDNAITRAEGSGLGLTISQQLVRLMGSELKVESQPGVGSHFWFDVSLPALDASPIETTSAEAPALPQSEADMALPPQAWRDALAEQAQRHNVLAVRKLLADIENDPQWASFVAHVQPFVRGYRFRQLGDWLASLSDARSEDAKPEQRTDNPGTRSSL
ncbi:MAG: hypothetical protein KDG55_02035 [Rhodocyclaceae bacterium]|nr:hypothetical protein [Rhodocyclaceae bacterium]